jgi:hypothetical protein
MCAPDIEVGIGFLGYACLILIFIRYLTLTSSNYFGLPLALLFQMLFFKKFHGQM